MNKFRNVRVEVDGIKFQSKAEAKRYGELKLLEKAGKISNLMLQKRIDLYASGVKICTYVADFDYYDNERKWPVVEDVKSPATAKLPLFRIKAKLFRANSGYDITVIGG